MYIYCGVLVLDEGQVLPRSAVKQGRFPKARSLSWTFVPFNTVFLFLHTPSSKHLQILGHAYINSRRKLRTLYKQPFTKMVYVAGPGSTPHTLPAPGPSPLAPPSITPVTFATLCVPRKSRTWCERTSELPFPTSRKLLLAFVPRAVAPTIVAAIAAALAAAAAAAAALSWLSVVAATVP